MRTRLFFILLMSGLLLATTSCKKDEDPDPTYTLSQNDLNKATTAEDLDVTGDEYGADVSIPHNGMPISTDSTFRDIYSNISKSDPIKTGTIFTKTTWMKNPDGSKGMLQVTFAMAKREAGYNPAGGDFEYVMMPNDGSNDYDANPNGMLPDVSNTNMRGKLGTCAGCHAKVSSYIFVRQ